MIDKKRMLAVDLTHRLPDINKYSHLPSEYYEYGRFAIMRNGNYWNGDISSSHPETTWEGFYWARKDNTLYLSPRGSAMRWPGVISDEIVLWLLRRLGLQMK